MASKFIVYATVLSLSIIVTTARDDGLQKSFSNILSKQAFVSHSSGAELSSSILQELHSIVSICNSNQLFISKNKTHSEALLKMKNILREQRDTESFLRLAGDLRDFPQMNFHLWLTAFLSVSYERDDLVTLQKPHPLALTPEFYLSQEAYEMANLQAQAAPENRVCIPVDGTLTTEAENGKEHALWYFREDLLFNFQHISWHNVHPKTEPIPIIDRRGEMFYFFHRTLLMRYEAERLAMGFDRVKSLVMEDGYVIEEGYFPHLAEMQSLIDFGSRSHNKSITGVSERGLEVYMKNVMEDTQQGYLISENGTQFSLLTSAGIDLLSDNVESLLYALNQDRYMESGVHNQGHVLLAELSQNGSYGIMAAPGAALRDPVFYRWHKSIDEIFELNKVMLPPYELKQGEFPLVWEGINVTSIEVTSVNMPTTPNILETFMGTQTVEIPYTPDGYTPLDNGTLEYCIKRLDHTDFQYKITTVRNESSANANATVRIFMAPRFDESGRPFDFSEQRRLFFPLDSFQVTLNSGETQIIRNSTQSTLSIPWKLEESENVPTPEVPYCGCGWPHHLLIPRGTSEGMIFDLFVLVTDSTGFETEPEDVCLSAKILCGVRGGKYPDPLPMGYPFERRPFNDPETNEVVASVEKYTQYIPNSKVIQVTILHRD